MPYNSDMRLKEAEQKNFGKNLLRTFIDSQDRAIGAVSDIRNTLSEMNANIMILSERLEGYATRSDEKIDNSNRRIQTLEERIESLTDSVRNVPTPEAITTLENSVRASEVFQWKALFIAGMLTTTLTILVTAFGRDIAEWGHEAIIKDAQVEKKQL